ncbi:hypothetical protein PSTG_20146 [Puccinia striiformis f. sp. tritici PST-78]|uniref:Uncharacterized protein n=1 Tax=Puccinia striiformis f. sp. tritici PST-78 TaxID=1165861 RepID=A0A0L0UHE5_9BASI|nr:hypothetical protein PSTG_20146 [Puccinia striiformis f. sp. tritici PST-78]
MPKACPERAVSGRRPRPACRRRQSRSGRSHSRRIACREKGTSSRRRTAPRPQMHSGAPAASCTPPARSPNAAFRRPSRFGSSSASKPFPFCFSFHQLLARRVRYASASLGGAANGGHRSLHDVGGETSDLNARRISVQKDAV